MEKGFIPHDSALNEGECPCLKDHVWPSSMDTSGDDLVRGFFEPALNRSVRYDRAVGYFSSGWLQANARGMFRFAANGGRGRWVTSLTPEPSYEPSDGVEEPMISKEMFSVPLQRVMVGSVRLLSG